MAAAYEGGDGPDALARRLLVPGVLDHRARHPDLLSDEQQEETQALDGEIVVVLMHGGDAKVLKQEKRRWR